VFLVVVRRLKYLEKWEALAETAEALVESVADQPEPARIEPAHHSADKDPPLEPT